MRRSSSALLRAVESDDAAFPAKLAAFRSAHDAFRAALAEPDYRYFAFQLWQEGVARYTEYQVALLAAERGYEPSAGFRGLPDFIDFSEAADSLHRAIFDNNATAGSERSFTSIPIDMMGSATGA